MVVEKAGEAERDGWKPEDAIEETEGRLDISESQVVTLEL